MSQLFDVPVLEGTLVRLEPLSMHHAEDLAVAADEDRKAYGFTWVPSGPETEDYLRSQLQRAETGKLAPFAQIRLGDDRVVGCTAYWDPRPWPGRSRWQRSKSASPGLPRQRRGRGSTPKRNFSCSAVPSSTWAWPGSTSRPMLETNDLVGR